MKALDPGAAVVYDEPLKLNDDPRRPRVLPGAVRRTREADLPGRQAAPARAQHDLRRRPVEAARHRDGRDGHRPRQAARQEGQGRGAEPGGAEGGLRLRRAAPAEAGSVPRRADGQDGGQDPHRGQRRDRGRRDDGRRDGGDLVSDHAIVDGRRDADRVPEEVPDGSRRRGRPPSPSCRPRTNWRRSAWRSAPAGRARVR